jgi:hypothetical protein
MTAAPASPEADRALLRRFEPVIRYTRGEDFFPMDVESYVRASSLWRQPPGGQPELLLAEGELTLERLSEPRTAAFGAIHYLKFIEPLNIAELAAYAVQEGLQKKDPADVFLAGPGRLARVGYGSRFVGALFSISLLARGRVPGDTAAAAAQMCERMFANGARHCYYGRVRRENGWVVLQYWFFYPFNNWRSGFFGVNDHEADWEMVCVYVPDTGPDAQPEWVAYASHDFAGDDLRRRWDDPEVEKVGEHPVIYAGAGSHASYYAPGEYLAELELPFLAPLVRLVDGLQKVWRRLIRESGVAPNGAEHSSFNVFRVPFVDYARGDGRVIGPGGRPWAEPVLLDETQGWAMNYRGLWGLYARDPIAGENAPAGPVFNRDGQMRRSWYDPLGWAGMDKVPPPQITQPKLETRQAALAARRADLEAAIADKSRELLGLGVEAAAMVGYPHLAQAHAAHQARIAELSKAVSQMRAELAGSGALAEALAAEAAEVAAGKRGALRAHIRRAHAPAPPADLAFNRFAEFWAAISIGLMLVAFVGLALFARQHLIVGLVAMLSVLIFVEAGFRRQLARLVDSITIALAIVCALILIAQWFWPIVIVAVLVAGGYIMWENLRELRS